MAQLHCLWLTFCHTPTARVNDVRFALFAALKSWRWSMFDLPVSEGTGRAVSFGTFCADPSPPHAIGAPLPAQYDY